VHRVPTVMTVATGEPSTEKIRRTSTGDCTNYSVAVDSRPNHCQLECI